MASWDLVFFERPFTINSVYGRMNHHQRSSLVTHWRESFKILAADAELPKGLSRIGVEALPVLATRSMQDAGGCVPAVKAAIDGLIDHDKRVKKIYGYGMIPDDGPEHLLWVTLHASVYEKGVNALWLRIHDLS